MPNPDDLMDEDERQWVELRKKAKDSQMTAHKNAPMSVKDWEAQKAAQEQRQRDALRAKSITPASLSGQVSRDPLDIDTKISLPSPASGQITPPSSVPVAALPATAPIAAPSAASSSAELDIWACYLDNETLYANSWEQMKQRIKDGALADGSYKVSEHKFNNTVDNVLGYFVPDQFERPKYTLHNEFEIIVRNNKVFRDEG